MQTLQTRNYALLAGEGCGRGTYIIVRTHDNACTSRNTGIDAAEDFKRFRRAYDISGDTFDDECAKETFEL